MLTDNELIQAFIEAEEQGFILDITDPSACNSECDECPADKACLQMSEGQNPTKFVKNFNKLLPQLINIIEKESK